MIGNTWVIYKDVNKGKNPKENSFPLYQAYTPNIVKSINLKVNQHTRCTYIRGAKHHKEDRLLR